MRFEDRNAEYSSRLEKAKLESLKVLEKNTAFCEALSESKVQTQPKVAETRSAPEAVKAPLYDLGQFNKHSSERDAYWKDNSDILKKLSNFNASTSSIGEQTVRNFGDIVKSGPRNEAETNLLNAAKTFLSPSEIDQAVRDNSPPSEVISKAEASVIEKIGFLAITIEADAIKQAADLEKNLQIAGLRERRPTLEDINVIDGFVNTLQKIAEQTPILSQEPEKEIQKPEQTPILSQEPEKEIQKPEQTLQEVTLSEVTTPRTPDTRSAKQKAAIDASYTRTH